MKYEILDNTGKVVNRIKASQEFVEKEHPGMFREIVEAVKEQPVIKSVSEQLEEIISKLDELLKNGKVV